jgi:hypothetical protein
MLRMRLPHLVLATSVIISVGACRSAPMLAQAHPNAGAPEVIEQRVRATFDAIARADTATLSGLLSDSLRWFSPTSGAVYNKPQLLGAPTA